MKWVQFMRQQWVFVLLGMVLLFFCGQVVYTNYMRQVGFDRLPVMEPAYNFTLTNQNRKSIQLASSTGKVRLLTFIYTQCLASCPLITHQMVSIQDDLKRQGLFGSHVELISVTLDPRHDTTTVLKSYASAHEADTRGWEFLTSSVPVMDTVMKQYGIYANPVGSSQYVHTIAEFLIDQHGDIRKIYGLNLTPSVVEQDIRSLLTSDSV